MSSTHAACAEAIAEGRLETQFLILVGNVILLGATQFAGLRSPGCWRPFQLGSLLPDCYRVWSRPNLKYPTFWGGSGRSVTEIITVVNRVRGVGP